MASTPRSSFARPASPRSSSSLSDRTFITSTTQRCADGSCGASAFALPKRSSFHVQSSLVSPSNSPSGKGGQSAPSRPFSASRAASSVGLARTSTHTVWGSASSKETNVGAAATTNRCATAASGDASSGMPTPIPPSPPPVAASATGGGIIVPSRPTSAVVGGRAAVAAAPYLQQHAAPPSAPPPSSVDAVIEKPFAPTHRPPSSRPSSAVRGRGAAANGVQPTPTPAPAGLMRDEVALGARGPNTTSQPSWVMPQLVADGEGSLGIGTRTRRPSDSGERHSRTAAAAVSSSSCSPLAGLDAAQEATVFARVQAAFDASMRDHSSLAVAVEGALGVLSAAVAAEGWATCSKKAASDKAFSDDVNVDKLMKELSMTSEAASGGGRGGGGAPPIPAWDLPPTPLSGAVAAMLLLRLSHWMQNGLGETVRRLLFMVMGCSYGPIRKAGEEECKPSVGTPSTAHDGTRDESDAVRSRDSCEPVPLPTDFRTFNAALAPSAAVDCSFLLRAPMYMRRHIAAEARAAAADRTRAAMAAAVARAGGLVRAICDQRGKTVLALHFRAWRAHANRKSETIGAWLVVRRRTADRELKANSFLRWQTVVASEQRARLGLTANYNAAALQQRIATLEGYCDQRSARLRTMGEARDRQRGRTERLLAMLDEEREAAAAAKGALHKAEAELKRFRAVAAEALCVARRAVRRPLLGASVSVLRAVAERRPLAGSAAALEWTKREHYGSDDRNGGEGEGLALLVPRIKEEGITGGFVSAFANGATFAGLPLITPQSLAATAKKSADVPPEIDTLSPSFVRKGADAIAALTSCSGKTNVLSPAIVGDAVAPAGRCPLRFASSDGAAVYDCVGFVLWWVNQSLADARAHIEAMAETFAASTATGALGGNSTVLPSSTPADSAAAEDLNRHGLGRVLEAMRARDEAADDFAFGGGEGGLGSDSDSFCPTDDSDGWWADLSDDEDDGAEENEEEADDEGHTTDSSRIKTDADGNVSPTRPLSGGRKQRQKQQPRFAKGSPQAIEALRVRRAAATERRAAAAAANAFRRWRDEVLVKTPRHITCLSQLGGGRVYLVLLWRLAGHALGVADCYVPRVGGGGGAGGNRKSGGGVRPRSPRGNNGAEGTTTARSGGDPNSSASGISLGPLPLSTETTADRCRRVISLASYFGLDGGLTVADLTYGSNSSAVEGAHHQNHPLLSGEEGSGPFANAAEAYDAQRRTHLLFLVRIMGAFSSRTAPTPSRLFQQTEGANDPLPLPLTSSAFPRLLDSAEGFRVLTGHSAPLGPARRPNALSPAASAALAPSAAFMARAVAIRTTLGGGGRPSVPSATDVIPTSSAGASSLAKSPASEATGSAGERCAPLSRHANAGASSGNVAHSARSPSLFVPSVRQTAAEAESAAATADASSAQSFAAAVAALRGDAELSEAWRGATAAVANYAARVTTVSLAAPPSSTAVGVSTCTRGGLRHLNEAADSPRVASPPPSASALGAGRPMLAHQQQHVTATGPHLPANTAQCSTYAALLSDMLDAPAASLLGAEGQKTKSEPLLLPLAVKGTNSSPFAPLHGGASAGAGGFSPFFLMPAPAEGSRAAAALSISPQMVFALFASEPLPRLSSALRFGFGAGGVATSEAPLVAMAATDDGSVSSALHPPAPSPNSALSEPELAATFFAEAANAAFQPHRLLLQFAAHYYACAAETEPFVGGSTTSSPFGGFGGGGGGMPTLDAASFTALCADIKFSLFAIGSATKAGQRVIELQQQFQQHPRNGTGGGLRSASNRASSPSSPLSPPLLTPQSLLNAAASPFGGPALNRLAVSSSSPPPPNGASSAKVFCRSAPTAVGGGDGSLSTSDDEDCAAFNATQRTTCTEAHQLPSAAFSSPLAPRRPLPASTVSFVASEVRTRSTALFSGLCAAYGEGGKGAGSYVPAFTLPIAILHLFFLWLQVMRGAKQRSSSSSSAGKALPFSSVEEGAEWFRFFVHRCVAPALERRCGEARLAERHLAEVAQLPSIASVYSKHKDNLRRVFLAYATKAKPPTATQQHSHKGMRSTSPAGTLRGVGVGGGLLGGSFNGGGEAAAAAAAASVSASMQQHLHLFGGQGSYYITLESFVALFVKALRLVDGPRAARLYNCCRLSAAAGGGHVPPSSLLAAGVNSGGYANANGGLCFEGWLSALVALSLGHKGYCGVVDSADGAVEHFLTSALFAPLRTRLNLTIA